MFSIISITLLRLFDKHVSEGQVWLGFAEVAATLLLIGRYLAQPPC